jgi:hypothetical protein
MRCMRSGAVPGALILMAGANGFQTCQVHGGLLDSFVACHTFICAASCLIMTIYRDDSPRPASNAVQVPHYNCQHVDIQCRA